MTVRQRLLRLVYPLVMLASRLSGGKSTMLKNEHHKKPATSLFDLEITLNNGQVLPLGFYQGKKILLVNTASNCGYTDQYKELQELYDHYHNKLVIIGFPANDFKEQEKGSDEEIALFCQVNYGVTFPLVKKSTVVNSAAQNPVYKWLSHPEYNGWNDEQPSWNFSKYLVNEEGILTHYFDPAISPLSKEVMEAINQ